MSRPSISSPLSPTSTIGSSPLFTLGGTLKPAEEEKDDAPTEVASLVERALKAWNDEFGTFVTNLVGAVRLKAAAAQAAGPNIPHQQPIDSPLAVPASIPASAPLLVKLPALLEKFRSQRVITRENYLVHILKAADRLKQCEQYAAARLCYQNYQDVAGTSGVAASTSSGGTSSAAPSLTGTLLANHVQVLFGWNECSFRLAISADPNLKEPASLQLVLSIMRQVQDAMSLLFNSASDESLSFLLYNGCLLLFHMVEPLIGFGYRTEAMEFISWIVMSMENMAVLCSVRYLSFRIKMYLLIAQMHEFLGENSTALNVAQRALGKIRELAQWESVEQPVPAKTLFLLTQAAQAVSIAIVKYSYLLGSVTDAQIETQLTTEFKEDQQSLLLLLELMRDPHARTADKYLSAVSAQKEFFKQMAQVENERVRKEEEINLAQAQAQAEQAAAIAAGTAKKTSGGKKGVSMAQEILAEVQAANAAAADGAGKTDRTSTGRSSSAKKKSSKRGANTGDEDAEPSIVPVRQDIRDPRAKFLVELALRQLRMMLEQETPVSVLNAHALGFSSGRDIVSAPTTTSKSSTSSFSHTTPGAWISLRTIFLVARSAFTHGCWEECEAATGMFWDRIAESPDRQKEIEQDRTDKTEGIGMETQLMLLQRMIALMRAQVNEREGVESVDVAKLQELIELLNQCTTSLPSAVSSPLDGTTTLSSPLSPTSPSPSSPLLPGSFLAVSKSPDLFSDVATWVWEEYLEGMVRSRRALRELPKQIVPPRALEDEARLLEQEDKLGVVRVGRFEHTAVLLSGLTALGKLLRVLRVPDTMWIARVALETAALLRDSELNPNSPVDDPVQGGNLKSILRSIKPAISATESYLGGVQLMQGLGAVGGTLHSVQRAFQVYLSGVKLNSNGTVDVESTRKPLARPFTRIDSSVSCAHVDLVLEYLDARLALGLQKAVTAAKAAHAKYIAELEKKYALTATYRKQPDPLLLPTYNSQTEAQLLEEAGANVYRRALTLLVMLSYRAGHAAQQEFVETRIRPCLKEVAAQESALLSYTQLRVVNAPSNIGACAYVLHNDFDHLSTRRTGEETSMEIAAAEKRVFKGKLPAPRFIARNQTTMVLRPVVPLEFRKRYRPRSVILYGKASETGIDVSSNNTEVVPLGLEYFLPKDVDEPLEDIVVRGLEENTSYVFACQCIGFDGEPITSIGVSSPRFVTCVPVSKVILEGLLVSVLRKLGDLQRLTDMSQSMTSKRIKSSEEEKTASALTAPSDQSPAVRDFYFSATILPVSYSILQPFLRLRAVASHTRPRARKRGQALRLGAGDRVEWEWFGEDSEEEEDGLEAERDSGKAKSDAITSYANRHQTNGLRDSYILGPVAREFEHRLDVWQLHIGLLQDAPRPLLYLLAKAAHAHADCLANRPVTVSGATRPLSLLQLHTLEIVRSLIIALQIQIVLEDWSLVAETILKIHNTLLPIMDGGVAPMGANTLLFQPLAITFQYAISGAATWQVYSTLAVDHPHPLKSPQAVSHTCPWQSTRCTVTCMCRNLEQPLGGACSALALGVAGSLQSSA